MSRYVRHQTDGEIRMDFYTFCKLPLEKVVETIRERGLEVARPALYMLKPVDAPRVSVVKEFA